MNELDRFGNEASCDVRAVSMSSRWGGGGEWTPKEAGCRVLVGAFALWLTTLIVGDGGTHGVWIVPISDDAYAPIITLVLVALVFGLVNGTLGRGSAPVDLNAILHDLYGRARYDLRLDYTQPAVPPLSDADADWARGLIDG